MNIEGRKIDEGEPCYIVAEMSANHSQNFDNALKIIRAAKKAGADAIKLQTYTPDTLTLDCNNKYFCLRNHPLWGGRTLYQLYKKAHTPWSWHKQLKQEADRIGITFFSTPFDETAVDFLEELGVGVYKIASFELMDFPLLKRVAQTKKPIILSTGMATLQEIKEAVCVLKKNGIRDIALLKCVSAYPAPVTEMNIRAIPHLKKIMRVPVGLSDHSLGTTVAVVAVALGANLIEKHLMLSKQDKTPDAAFSLTPAEFKKMTEDIRLAEKALGRVSFERTNNEKKNLKFRRSIFSITDINKGERLTKENIRIIRPGFGLPPSDWPEILGKRAKASIKRGMPLKMNLIEYGTKKS